MTQKLVYLIQRYQMSLASTTAGMTTYPERVFEAKEKAHAYCAELDPNRQGFEWECPCGCGDNHWRSWDVEAIVMEMGK